jgi:hypothetical protein
MNQNGFLITFDQGDTFLTSKPQTNAAQLTPGRTVFAKKNLLSNLSRPSTQTERDLHATSNDACKAVDNLRH